MKTGIFAFCFLFSEGEWGMNPGVQATIITIVCLILVMFGWGSKTLEDGKLRIRAAACFLIVYLLADGWNLALPSGLHGDIGGLVMPLVFTGWAMAQTDSWSYRLQWMMGMLTVACVLVVLMTLVPLDPAFFPFDAVYLYPTSAALVSVLSVRRPFAAVSIAVVGMALATFVDPFIHDRNDVHSVVFGGAEMRDFVAYTAAGVLVTHGLYHACARYVLGLLKNLFGKQEGGPEHV
jgi:hypothetical protein